jgi:RNA polymerase sigma-70 factor, ECF subfamily
MALSGKYSSRVAISLSSDNDASRTGDCPTSHSDEHLVLAARLGCRIAFDELLNLYSRRVYRTVFSITKNAHDAEDAMQDSFFRAFLALDHFEGRASFYSWLTRISINSALGILRKRRSHPETSLDRTSQCEGEGSAEEFRDLAPDPEQVYAEHQRHAKLTQAIGRLPKGLRDTIQTHLTEDCSVREVAYRLNISEAAAKSRLYRARTQLCSLTAAPLRAERPGRRF